MKKKIIIATISLVVLIGLGVGVFFIVKHISDENHKKDIEMAADCARTFEVSSYSSDGKDWNTAMREMEEHNAETRNRRRTKRQECAEKYHVTHQEIIDKIGEENYFPQ